MDNQSHSNKVFLLVIFSLLSFIFILLIFSLLFLSKKSPGGIMTETSPTPTIVSGKGVLRILPQNYQPVYKMAELITFVISADSGDEKIAGYDAVLNYNQDNMRLVSHKSLNSDFQVFVNQKEKDRLAITGTRQLNKKTPPVLTNTLLVQLTFRPIKEGKVSLSLLFTPGDTRDSNLMNELVRDVLGKSIGTVITIGK